MGFYRNGTVSRVPFAKMGHVKHAGRLQAGAYIHE